MIRIQLYFFFKFSDGCFVLFLLQCIYIVIEIAVVYFPDILAHRDERDHQKK